MWVGTTGFDFRQLRCFVTVAEELHFGKAATRLNLSNSAVSKHVRLLERQLGVELLERTSRRVRLTEFGLLMLDHARAVLAEVETMRLLALNSSRSPIGHLAVGYRAAASDLMAQLSRAFRLAVPGIDLLPTCLTVAEIDGAVRSGHLDLGLSSLASATSMDESRVFDVRILSRRHWGTLVTPVDHRLTKLGRPPTIADLDREVIVMAERGTHPELLDRFAEILPRSRRPPHSPRVPRKVTRRARRPRGVGPGRHDLPRRRLLRACRAQLGEHPDACWTKRNLL